jgi:hypothetical protein
MRASDKDELRKERCSKKNQHSKAISYWIQKEEVIKMIRENRHR